MATLALDRVIFVPAGSPPHKLGEPVTAYCHRFAMLALALQHDPRLLVGDLEMDATAPSFTVTTLERLRAAWPADRLFFLMGSDSFAELTTWHRWRELPTLATLVILARPGRNGAAMPLGGPPEFEPRLCTASAWRAAGGEEEGRIVVLDNEGVEVAATDLRRALRAGVARPPLLDPAVAAYAVKHRIYEGQEDHGR